MHKDEEMTGMTTEYSAWMRQAIGKRITEVSQNPPPHSRVVNPAGVEVIVTHLAHHSEIGEAEDRMCDRCRTYVEAGLTTRTIEVRPMPGVPHMLLIGGFCAECDEFGGVE